MPKKLKTIRLYDAKSLRREKIAQHVRDDMVIGHSERSEGGRRPLLDLETTQDFSRHPRNKFGAGSELQLLLYASCDERYKGGCPRVVSGSINGGRSPHITTCHRGTRSVLLDSGASQVSPCHRARVARSQKAAFTLAEVLITLAIIGVVAALTIPSLIENHNEKAWSTAKDLWQKKLVEATRQMNIDGVMTRVAGTTEDFMDYFKKYVKIIKTCDNNKLKNCYSPKIVQTAGDEVEVSGLKSAKNLGHDDWGTNTTGFVIADGTTVIMAYNPNCDSVDPFSKEGQNGQVGCMSMMIDVNGKKGPNKVGKDILLSNASISKSGCDIELGDLCLAGSDLTITPISTCEGEDGHKYDERLDSQNTYCSNSYWGGAKKACDELDMRLPTPQELADIATYIYKQEDNPVGATEYRSDITLDSDRISKLGISISSYYWSNELYGNDGANLRYFDNSYSRYSWGYVDLRSYRTRCISN